ncbi:A1 cistron-splicing factor [Cercophora newfieldiana]|uniref:A1 cistron-splicing factor n=1 Tax=Cercophora newfieldiana TaxID=92897 RepID=A0AA40CPV7_9PEZI|nr:A1 cistron-splicing factor [Cercophora newfieldiana]
MTDTAAMWHQLTDAITAPFLDRITGKKGVTEWLVDSMDSVRGDSRLPSCLATASETYRALVGNELHFAFSEAIQDLRILADTSRSSDPDTTSRVLPLWEGKEADVVAELQFVFITGTHLGNTACLEYWWKFVLKIVLHAFKLALQRPTLSSWLLRTLHAQLAYTNNNVEPLQQDGSANSDGPSGDRLLFHSLPHSKKLLHSALVEYKSRINTLLVDLGNRITPEQKEVGYALDDLEAWLWRFGWDLRKTTAERRMVWNNNDDEEEEDDLPVIVDIDEDGREVGLVSFHRD